MTENKLPTMKDFRLLLAGIILLLLIILLGVFTWLWKNNGKNIDPLPIMVNENASTASSMGIGSGDEEDENDLDSVAAMVLHLQAEESLQVALDAVIVKFESRYPKIQVLARYVPNQALLTLPETTNEPSPPIIQTDMIIADGSLNQNQLAPLQTTLNETQAKLNQIKINAGETTQNNNEENEEGQNTADTIDDNNGVRNLTSFSYALKGELPVDGVILTDNPVASSFRNFILSSAGQDVLKQYDYNNIDGYKNSMDDLFNPTSRAKSASDDSSVKVADALSNGE